MSYQKLLLEYAQTLGDNDKSNEGGRRRLRWEKDEAMGNSKFRWTGTKVRYAHVVNRSLQMKLHKNVSVWAKTHGSKCNEIEAKQREVWKAQVKRNTRIGSSYLDKSDKQTPKISEPVYHNTRRTRNTPSQIRSTATPFSTASDFSIYKKPFDPLERKDVKRPQLAVRQWATRVNSRSSSSDLGTSYVRISRLGDRRTSFKAIADANVLLVH